MDANELFWGESQSLLCAGEWVPHITLANRDVSPEKMKCLANLLSSRPLAWDIQVDKLAVVCAQKGKSDVYKQYQLRE